MSIEYEESERLDLFLEKVEELANTRMIQAGDLQGRITLNSERMKGLRVDTWRPDDATLRSFLMVFRHFVSEKEPVFLNHIANLCWREIHSDRVRGELAKARAHWKESQRTGSLGLIINQENFDPAFVLDLMINGVYFHSDSRKRRKVKELDWLSAQFVQQVFVNYLIEGSRYTAFLRNIIVITRSQGLLRI